MRYIVRRAHIRPELRGAFDGPAWREADVADITHFHPQSSDHHPRASAKLLYDDTGMYAAFHVQDRYVVCRHTQPQDPVCTDSCAEWFVQPNPERGYFNFELNCGGAMLLYYVTDPTRTDGGGIKGFEPVGPEWLRTIRIYHSMPEIVDPELPGTAERPIEWTVEYFVPNKVFEAYTGPLVPPGERQWRGNFYKCADKSSHPHWGSWSPIGAALNFHVPEHFAAIDFAG
jgi:hypothetical protein